MYGAAMVAVAAAAVVFKNRRRVTLEFFMALPPYLLIARCGAGSVPSFLGPFYLFPVARISVSRCSSFRHERHGPIAPNVFGNIPGCPEPDKPPLDLIRTAQSCQKF